MTTNHKLRRGGRPVVVLLLLLASATASPAAENWMQVGYAAGDGPLVAQQATDKALAGRLGQRPALLLVFESLPLAGSDVLAAIRAAAGTQVPIVGCSSYGQITADGIDAADRKSQAPPSVAVAAFFPARTRPGFRVTHLPAKDETATQRALWTFAAGGPVAATALLVFAHPDSVYGAEGLDLVGLLNAPGHEPVPTFGGIAGGDNKTDGRAVLYGGDGVIDSGIVVVAIDGPVSLSFASRHALTAEGPSFHVTRSEGRRVLELDGQPARDVVDRLFAECFPDELDRHLGIVCGEELVNMGFRAGPDSALHFSRNMPIGTTVRVQGGDTQQMDPLPTDQQALQSVAEGRAQAVLIFNCVGRRPRDGDAGGKSLQVLRRTLADVPVIGFYAGGEIGPVRGPQGAIVNQFHHTTAVVLGLSPTASTTPAAQAWPQDRDP